MIARLRAGASVAEAQAEIDAHNANNSTGVLINAGPSADIQVDATSPGHFVTIGEPVPVRITGAMQDVSERRIFGRAQAPGNGGDAPGVGLIAQPADVSRRLRHHRGTRPPWA